VLIKEDVKAMVLGMSVESVESYNVLTYSLKYELATDTFCVNDEYAMLESVCV
jgi:hypothetical protein